jgi:palmitoyl-protein thioesterase
LEKSGFLADINNERVLKNASYVDKIAALEKFVMVIFEEDTTVIPRESGWFAEVNGTSGAVTPLQRRPIYLEDWIGLKALGEKDGLVFLKNPGDHMQLDDKVLKKTFKEYFGPESKSKGRQQKADL